MKKVEKKMVKLGKGVIGVLQNAREIGNQTNENGCIAVSSFLSCMLISKRSSLKCRYQNEGVNREVLESIARENMDYKGLVFLKMHDCITWKVENLQESPEFLVTKDLDNIFEKAKEKVKADAKAEAMKKAKEEGMPESKLKKELEKIDKEKITLYLENLEDYLKSVKNAKYSIIIESCEEAVTKID